MGNEVPPAGFEQLLQHTGITYDCIQGGTESGTVGESTRLVQLFEILATREATSEKLLILWSKLGPTITQRYQSLIDATTFLSKALGSFESCSL